MEKTHWKKLTNPDYIGAYTIMDGERNDKELIVTIDRVVRQMVQGPDGKKEECTVCHLKNQKPFILNATNQKIMTKLFGSPFIEDWSGKMMSLYVAKVKAFGEVIDALRVKSEPPVIKLPELTPTHQRWAGALKAMKDGNISIVEIKKNFILSAENEKTLVDAGIANL